MLSFRKHSGQGGAVALCWHRAGGSAEDFDELAARLADAGITVLAVDGPGHGASPSLPADEMRPPMLARQAADLLDRAGVDRVVFIGFSWGATVACWFAAQWPSRTAAVVLLEGAHVDFVDLPGFEPPPLDSADVESAMARGSYVAPAGATFDRLASAAVPVLFIGRGISPAGVSELGFDPIGRLQERVPQTTVIILDGHDHELLRSDAERVADEVIAWLGERH